MIEKGIFGDFLIPANSSYNSWQFLLLGKEGGRLQVVRDKFTDLGSLQSTSTLLPVVHAREALAVAERGLATGTSLDVICTV